MAKWKKELNRKRSKHIFKDLELFQNILFQIQLKTNFNNPEYKTIQLMRDWIESNKNSIIYNLNKLAGIEKEKREKKWEIELKPKQKGEYDITYFAGKKCINCRDLMKTLYFRDTDRKFHPVGLICFKCNILNLFPDKVKKDIQNSELQGEKINGNSD